MSIALIAKGHSAYVISLRKNAEPPERFAAEELRRYLHRIGGADLPMETESGRARVIRLTPTWKSVSPDAFSIQTRATKLILSGASLRAVLYAVYTFLEECLGCAWLRPGEETIPNLAEVIVGPLDIRQQPSFRDRILVHFQYYRARALEQIDWAAKQKLNISFLCINHDLPLWDAEQTRERVIPELRKRGMELRTPGHSFFTWLPPSKYFKTHPEYFTLKDGRRHANKYVCVSNPAVAREMAKNIRIFLRTNPEVKVITLWHTDLFEGFCECEPCRALIDSSERSFGYMYTNSCGDLRWTTPGLSTTRAEVCFLNRVAEQIERSHPDVLVESLAYATNNNPTCHDKPRRNVLVGFAVFDKLLAPEHALTPIAEGRFHKPAREYIREWRRQSNHFYIYEYYGLFHDFTPLWNTMAKDFRFYRKLGVDGISTEIAGWNELHMHVFAKLAWNCRQPWRRIVRSYCEGAYGPAADLMFEYWMALQAAALPWNWNRKQANHVSEKNPLRKWFYARQNPKWKRTDSRCRALLRQANQLLRLLPLARESARSSAGPTPLDRVRCVQARWDEVPATWWRTPADHL